MARQRIGIIGGGSVGLALGTAFSRAGHDVVYGLREGSSSRADVEQAGGKVAPVADAAKAPVIVLAVPGNAVADTVTALGDVSGRVLVDATNAFGPPGAKSGAEQLAALAHGARVVKAFNTTGAENMADAKRLAHAPLLPLCGDDADAKALVKQLAMDIGFEAVDVGPLASAGMLESLARLWVTLARGGQGRDFAFAITRTR